MDRKPLNIRPLNVPRPVRVVEDANGAPISIDGRRVTRVVDRWRIDDEWRRNPTSRMYLQVETDLGTIETVFHDLIDDKWYRQRA